MGEKGKTRGQLGKISASEPFPLPSDYTSRLALLANCFPFSPNSEPGPRLSFDRDHLGNKIIKTRSPKTTAKLIQNNVGKSALKSIKLPSLKVVHFKQLRRVALQKLCRGLYLVGKLARLYAAAVLLIPRGLCGLGHVVRAHDLTVRGG